MLLCVIDVVTTELMRPLLMKPTVSFDVRNTGKNLCITGFHLGWNVVTLEREGHLSSYCFLKWRNNILRDK